MRLSVLLGLTVGVVFSDDIPAKPRFKNMTIHYNGSLEIEDNNLESWHEEDFIEVYLAEYHLEHAGLNSWVGFSTAHMAVMFQNPRNRKWFVMDSYAQSAETVANLVMPSIPPDSPFNTMSLWERLVVYLQGGIVEFLKWDNAGYVRTHEEKSDEFEDLRHIGTVLGRDVIALRQWAIREYARQNLTHPFTFDMWQIFNGSTNERIRKSRMCHDFVEEILGRIKFVKNEDPTYSMYAEEHAGPISINRDGLNLNVTHWEELDMTNAKIRRDYQRFLRFFRNHIYQATSDLFISRMTVTKLIALGIPTILFLDGNKWMRLTLSKYGAFNYCRMPMDFERGKSYLPSKLNDTRHECFMPPYNYHDFQDRMRFTLSDLLLAAEQKLDDALFGVDGRGGDLFSHLALIVESSVILLAVTNAVRWIVTTSAKRIQRL